ncbi:MAG: NAD(P)-binding protein [Erythrobacter sp.]|nr:NAD(P)-binding protein [Erythrobacter sp.]
MARLSVAIIGGGVAGMSAAHELMRRNGHGVDYDITVYDANPNRCGGKARSIPAPNSGTDGREDLPGEHGFRFFPGFYRHLPDTMEHIPYGDPADDANVFHNLCVADRLEIPRHDKPPLVISARFPKSLSDLETDFKAIFLEHTGLTAEMIEFFAERIWQILTSCKERRLEQYEGMTWRKFLQPEKFGDNPEYVDLLINGLSRSLLANDPTIASLRTTGDTNVQLILGIIDPGHPTDRLLNGPTSKVWLDPWFDYLTGHDVTYHLGNKATEITFAGGQVESVTIESDAGTSEVKADYYIFALPVERMADLLDASPTGAGLVPAFADIIGLKRNVRWMNGVQFFLYEDVPITHGHMLFADSPWAITGISEAQFWSQEHLENAGDGTVNGVLSFCISEWDEPGRFNGKIARDCTDKELAMEVWEEVKQSVNACGEELIKDSNRHSWFFDPDIVDHDDGGKLTLTDAEPLFINVKNSWEKRPDVEIGVPNMLLASDYIRTYTDVACMEAANEAARRAVNALLKQTGSHARPCKLWPLHEPDVLWFWRNHDKHRFERGLDWDGKI